MKSKNLKDGSDVSEGVVKSPKEKLLYIEDLPMGEEKDIPKVFEDIQVLRRYLTDKIVNQDELVDLVMIALLSGEGLLLEGNPGVGKSTVVRLACVGSGLNYFYRQLHRDSRAEELVGPINPKKFFEDGQIDYARTGLCRAHVAFIDEVNQGGSGVLEVLREATNEKAFQGVPIPLLSFFYTVNKEIGKELTRATSDRLALSYRIQGNLEREDEEACLEIIKAGKKKQSDYVQKVDPMSLLKGIKLSSKVKIPEEVYLGALWFSIAVQKLSNISLSDRLIVQIDRIMRASAIYHGRTVADVTDLYWLKHMVREDHRTNVPKNQTEKILEAVQAVTSYKMTRTEEKLLDARNAIKTLDPKIEHYLESKLPSILTEKDIKPIEIVVGRNSNLPPGKILEIVKAVREKDGPVEEKLGETETIRAEKLNYYETRVIITPKTMEAYAKIQEWIMRAQANGVGFRIIPGSPKTTKDL
ncbi:MAG: AAA family ATPase [Candidatus Bathyarchaeia archaeon]